MSPVIELRGVRRRFGAREVLRGVSATAEEGKVIGLLGRNGEGKTTLFRIMLDILAADSGEIRVLGMSPDGSGDIRSKAGFIPEKPVFHDFMDIGEALELRSRLFPTWNKEKASALAKRLGLDPSTKIRGASKGTLGKLAWVCAVAHDPKLLLLDEPTSGLDALVRDDVLNGLIEELLDSGKTIVIANHRMEEVASVLDEVWLLAGGVIAAAHPMERLRAEAKRVTGRLKEGAAVPADLPVFRLGGDGPLAEFAALDAEAAGRLQRCGALEGAQEAPLPVNEILKCLLRVHGA